MKSILKRIFEATDVEEVKAEPRRYSVRVALQQETVSDALSIADMDDEDAGYNPYDTGRFGAGKS